MFDIANQRIDEALEKNKNKIEFLNHKAVILQQLYDITGGDQLLDELKLIYNYIMKNTDRYYKTNLNYASTLIRSVKKKARMAMLDQFPDFSNLRQADDLGTNDYDAMMADLITSKDILRKNIEIAPRFINNYYKLGEALTVQYAVQKYCSEYLKEDEKTLEEEAVKAFECAKEISNESIPCKLCECAFYRTIGNAEKADPLEAEVMELLGKQ